MRQIEARCDKTFDEAADTVVRAMNGDGAGMTTLISNFDNPDELVMHLANNPDRLEQFAKLSPVRKLAELAKIQSQVSPHGSTNSGHDPAWMKREVRGFRNGGADYPSTPEGDRDWNKAFDRHMANRAKAKGWLK